MSLFGQAVHFKSFLHCIEAILMLKMRHETDSGGEAKSFALMTAR